MQKTIHDISLQQILSYTGFLNKTVDRERANSFCGQSSDDRLEISHRKVAMSPLLLEKQFCYYALRIIPNRRSNQHGLMVHLLLDHGTVSCTSLTLIQGRL